MRSAKSGLVDVFCDSSLLFTIKVVIFGNFALADSTVSWVFFCDSHVDSGPVFGFDATHDSALLGCSPLCVPSATADAVAMDVAADILTILVLVVEV